MILTCDILSRDDNSNHQGVNIRHNWKPFYAAWSKVFAYSIGYCKYDSVILTITNTITKILPSSGIKWLPIMYIHPWPLYQLDWLLLNVIEACLGSLGLSRLFADWTKLYCGSWIYYYLCNQCISSLMLWLVSSRRGVLDTTLCDKVYQWLTTGRWFSPGTSISSTN